MPRLDLYKPSLSLGYVICSMLDDPVMTVLKQAE
jgi:hypothetical protein